MGRAKLKMELITKEKTRNTTYQKRKLGIIKKANEFTILCDVDTVIIIYPPNSSTPEIWPENPEKIKKTIASYKAKKGETGKRTYDLNDFFEDRKKKIEDELVKARRKNLEAKYATWFDDLDNLPEGQLRVFANGLENKENVVRAHLEFKKRNMNVNYQLPFVFDPGHFVDLGLNPGQAMNHYPMNHDNVGWFNDATIGGSFLPLKREQPVMGFVYPMFDDGLVNDNLNGQWGFPPPPTAAMHGGVMPDYGMQEGESHVNVGGGDFMMDEHRGRFLG